MPNRVERVVRAALLVWVVVGAAAGCTRPLQNAPCPCLTPEWMCCAGSCVPAGGSCAQPVDGARRDDGVDGAGDGTASDHPADSSAADQRASTIDGGAVVGPDGAAAPDARGEVIDAPPSQPDGPAGGAGGDHGNNGGSGGGGSTGGTGGAGTGGVGTGGAGTGGVGTGGAGGAGTGGAGTGGAGTGGAGTGGAGGMAKATGVLAGRVTTSIDPGAPFALPVPGALVTLSGPESRQAITDANGSYRFERLSPGPYAVQAWQPGFAADAGAGQQLTPSPLDSDRVVEATGPGVVQNFTCASPCQAATAQPLAREVDPARELVIKDSAVVEDARADNAAGGPWSFRYLMERMAWGTSPNVLAESWMANMARSGRDVAALRSSWPTIVEVGQVVPDLARAPFRLLAIVNRLDLRAVGNGELRFIYGIYPVAGAPTFNQQGATFTISIDFHLPTTPDLTDRQAWARRFHDLGAIPFEESARYNSALQALTDVVDARPATFDPRNPSGSNLSAFRVNERFRTSAPAQLRQFRLQPDPSSGALALTIALLPQTPDWALAGTDGMLPQLLNQQAALVQTGFVVLPDALLGSVAPAPSPPTPWSFPSITSQPLRQAFAGQTCMGCHWSEVPGPSPLSTFHVDPTGTSVSAFVSQIDLPRRIAFLRHQLTCSAASCAAGGAEMMPPPP